MELKIHGLEVTVESHRYVLALEKGEESGRFHYLVGGSELEKIFKEWHYAYCSISDFEAAVELVKCGMPLNEVRDRINACRQRLFKKLPK